jgi:hypothetical protein
MEFPFEESADEPVVYYRIRTLMRNREGLALYPDSTDINNSLIDLSRISGIYLDYFFYYPKEEGLGGHVHDVESVEMRLLVARQPKCDECRYAISVQKVVGKAHGILWYDNTLFTDQYTKFPLAILVEEGKHASCTDKNGDGYYTPGYDVNRRVNDAWGVRDVMRTGALYTGGFEAWFAKVRWAQDRVFPPLPPDSPVWENYERHLAYGSLEQNHATYSLRPFPKLAAAEAFEEDPRIVHFVDKGYDDWPEEEDDTGLKDLAKWLEEENFVKSLSLAYRYDGKHGLSLVFPLLIVKNISDPVAGGWLVNRMFFKGHHLQDCAWNVMYTSSASRWIDGYFALGWEWNRDTGSTESHFMTESGIKFRGTISTTPLRFLSKLGTDFWGLRVGLMTWGFADFDRIGYIVEVGAGTF